MDVFVEVIGETEKSLQFESFFFSDYLLYLFSQKDSIMLHLSYGMWFTHGVVSYLILTIQQMNPPIAQK